VSATKLEIRVAADARATLAVLDRLELERAA
jgi:hypothetical protein